MENSPVLSFLPDPLLSWYRRSARVLPWRSDPTPYHVWISEIMLQQTRVEAVKEYYHRFLEELPTVFDLAEAPEQKLLKLWEGLGYYNRARNLQKAARVITEEYHGELPADYALLQKLPGIGRYTAGAIGSIAFGLPVPAVDGNVLRVLSRLLADYSNTSRPEVKTQYENLLLEILPDIARNGDAGDFTQALMELGAMVCVPNGAPKCLLCPLSSVCQGFQKGVAEELPVKDGKKPRNIVEKTVFILRHEEKIAIQKRPDKGLLAGMWELPSLDASLKKADIPEAVSSVWGLTLTKTKALGKTKHIFTHIEWKMNGFSAEVAEIPENLPFLWVTEEELLSEYPLPSAFKFYQNLCLRHGEGT